MLKSQCTRTLQACIPLTHLHLPTRLPRLSPSSARQFILEFFYGQAHLPPPQQAPDPYTRVSASHVDEVGSCSAQPSSQEGPQAAHRPTAQQVRRRLNIASTLDGNA